MNRVLGAMQVQEMEIQQIFAAVAELQQTEKAMIPLTYIVCQKRHMTRLWPGDRNTGDRNGKCTARCSYLPRMPFFVRLPSMLTTHLCNVHACTCNRTDVHKALHSEIAMPAPDKDIAATTSSARRSAEALH